MDYRHPVQGWVMPLPVEDAQNPPEVFYVKGARLERADLQPAPREDALALIIARALQRECEPGTWELLPLGRQDVWLGRGRIALGALMAEGVVSA